MVSQSLVLIPGIRSTVPAAEACAEGYGTTAMYYWIGCFNRVMLEL